VLPPIRSEPTTFSLSTGRQSNRDTFHVFGDCGRLFRILTHAYFFILYSLAYHSSCNSLFYMMVTILGRFPN